MNKVTPQSARPWWRKHARGINTTCHERATRRRDEIDFDCTDLEPADEVCLYRTCAVHRNVNTNDVLS
jgi:hypothetical protein